MTDNPDWKRRLDPSSQSVGEIVVWMPFDKGATIGQRGGEGGIILRDEEHESGARITLERNCLHGVPFSVTCGVYGWFFHTRRLASEAEADLPAMLDGLAVIVDLIPRIDDPDADGKTCAVGDAIHAFVDKFA